MRQQYVQRDRRDDKPVVIDERQPGPATSDQPVRTVLYVEVGDMEPARVQLLMQQINAMYDGARGGIHYIVPIRHGKIGSDIVFETEFLRTVRELCEVNQQGEIVLKNGATECHIIRHQI